MVRQELVHTQFGRRLDFVTSDGEVIYAQYLDALKRPSLTLSVLRWLTRSIAAARRMVVSVVPWLLLNVKRLLYEDL